MAQKVLQQLEEQLNCSICLDTFTDPKLLQCFHVYCQQCLVPLVDQDQEGLTCPTCRQVTPIPDRGVAGLQSAFHINRFLEIKESLEKPENPATTPEEATPTDVKPIEKPWHCFLHEGKELELYCRTCGELICWKCIAKGSKHHDHDYEELDQAYMKYSQEITSLLKPMEKQVTIAKNVLTQFDARCGEISNQRAATAGNIHVTFRRLREVLNVRETELISQLDQLTQGKLKDLAVQRDQIETTLAQLNGCLHFMRESLRAGHERDVLMMKKSAIRQVKELATPFQPDILEPNTEADIVFTASADMPAVCRKYRKVFAAGLPDPSQCHIMGKVAEVAAVGEKCTAILQAVDFEGELRKESIKSLECNFVSTPILIIGEVNFPWGVAVNQRGEVVVTEWGGHCVSVFSPSGEKLRSFGTCGFDPGQVVCPREVTVDGEGNILVVDGGDKGRIQRFTPEGSSVGSSGYLQFYPTGIAFNASSNKVYVADSGNHRVHVLNSDLTLSSTFGEKGSGEGQFSFPCGIACDNTGKVYVADSGSHRIQVFTPGWGFLRMFGTHGSPVGVAVGATDMVYVSEDHNLHVSVFTSEGRFVTSFGRVGECGCLRGLAVDNRGVVYVCDYHCIQLF